MNRPNKSYSAILSQIEKLSVSEKISIVEDIWESITITGEHLSVTPKQKKELDKRYIDYKNNSKNVSPWKKVKKRIESNL